MRDPRKGQFDSLTRKPNPPPGGPLFRHFKDGPDGTSTADRGFSRVLEGAILEQCPDRAEIAKALKQLELRQGFRLFALNDDRWIDADDKNVQLLRDEGHRKGWAVYIAEVRAVWSCHSLNDPATVCASLNKDDGRALFRTLMALEELGQCEFQIMSIRDSDGTDIVPRYDENPVESRLRFHSLRRFLQPDFFQLDHQDQPIELEDGTMSEARTWTRDAVLFVPRTTVWEFLTPTIRDFYSGVSVHPFTRQSFRYCGDKALVTLASHFLKIVNTATKLNRDGADKLDLKNALNVIQLLSVAPPFTRKASTKFKSVCRWPGQWPRFHNESLQKNMEDLVAFLEDLVPVLTGAAVPYMLQSFAMECLNIFMGGTTDPSWRLAVVKMFPQHLLPSRIDEPALWGCVLSLILGATEIGDDMRDGMVHEVEVEERAEALKYFRDGEALADAIISYGRFSPLRDQVLASSIGPGDRGGASFNPLTMGFITRLSVKPEGESLTEKSARMLLRTEVTNACMDAVTRGVFVEVKTCECDCDGNCDCPRDYMEPGQLARFILKLSSFRDNESLSKVMGMMLTRDLSPRRRSLRSFWLPFWHGLINMDASSLEACAGSFWQTIGHYNNRLKQHYEVQPDIVQASKHNPVGGYDLSATVTDSLIRGVYDWLTSPKSTAALVAEGPLHRLKTYYDGLHGEYLSTRVTPIPDTDQGELLIVKRLHNTIKEDDDDKDEKLSRNIRCMIRAELEWRLFTEFRPMLPFLSEGDLRGVLGHTTKLDRDVDSLNDAYLEAFNVPSTQKFKLAPEIATDSIPMPTTSSAPARPGVETELEGLAVRSRPQAQLQVNTKPATKRRQDTDNKHTDVEDTDSEDTDSEETDSEDTNSEETDSEETDSEDDTDSENSAEEDARDPDVVMVQDEPSRGVKRRALSGADESARRVGSRSHGRR